jgi:hypothetical protein
MKPIFALWYGVCHSFLAAILGAMTATLAWLMRTYRRAIYRVFAAGTAIEFRIGRRCPDLDALLAREGAGLAAFITAYNPMSVPRPDPANRAADRALRRALAAGGWRWWPGEGADPDGRWRPEPSYLVLAMGPSAARLMARRFGQAAIVILARDRSPRLESCSK